MIRRWAAVALLLGSADGFGADAAAQRAQYQAQQPKTVVELQPFRSEQTIDAGTPAGRASLLNLNPAINSWFVLSLQPPGGAAPEIYHLENALPQQQLLLSDAYATGLQLVADGETVNCALWSDAPTALQRARATALAYAPLCGGRLYLRNTVRGTYTQIERTTNFLRDHVWGGEKIVTLVRDHLFQDAFIENAEPGMAAAGTATARDHGPAPARLDEGADARSVRPESLGIDIGAAAQGMRLGRWYGVRDAAGLFVSAIEPRAIDPTLLAADRNRVNALDAVEAAALDYLVAFDLAYFDLGFGVGTDHPRVGWSPRAPDSVRDDRLPGPDGIGSIAPLAGNGMVSPAFARRVAAAFTGGFKRDHGAFRYGALAERNAGSHYGFIEHGATLSKLQPGLATLYVLDDGRVGMKTWTRQDDALLPRIRHARQNGVAVIEFDEATGMSVPGPLLTRWGAGNWSGSKDGALRTLRAGACLQEHGGRQYLIYGWISTGTPSAMARVFQAYGCRYAMHLDMNALEHTYLAVYTHRDGQLQVQHLATGMAVVDRKGGENALAPRFIGFPDDRDFFYLLRRATP